MASFDRIAPVYDALKWPLGPGAIDGVARELALTLPAGSRALVLGGGTGRVMTDLLEAGRARAVVYLEPSAAMTARARARARAAGALGSVAFRRGGVETLREGETFELIVTPFVLDLFGPDALVRTMDRLDRALAQGGSWLFTDFALDRSGPWGRSILAGLYAFFRAACAVEARTLPDFDREFARLGYACTQETRRVGGLILGRVYRRP